MVPETRQWQMTQPHKSGVRSVKFFTAMQVSQLKRKGITNAIKMHSHASKPTEKNRENKCSWIALFALMLCFFSPQLLLSHIDALLLIICSRRQAIWLLQRTNYLREILAFWSARDSFSILRCKRLCAAI